MTRIRGGIRLCAVLAALCSGLSLFATLSNSVYVDCREVCIVAGKTYVAPSSGNPSARPQVDGGTAAGWRTEDPRWDSDSVEDGWHTLSIDGEDATPRVLCLNGDGIAVHAGVIFGSEVWGEGKVHVVRGWVRIEEGAQLTVERGAIVKFSQGTGMMVNGTLLGDGAVFTALADDSAGGDTDCNGTGGQFSTYAITGDGTISLQEAVVRYMSPPADWKAPEGMQNSMSLSLVVRRADGTRIESNGSVVGVFDRRGGCRGMASLRTTAWGAKVYQGQVFSNEASERGWSIKVWNTGESMARSIAETVDFIQDDAWGTAREPRDVHAAHRVFLDGVDKGWYDYLQEVTIAAPAPRRKVFDTWAADGIGVPYEMQSVNPLVFTMPDNEVRLYSSFMYPNFLAWTLKKGWNWVSVNLEPNADISYVLREYAPRRRRPGQDQRQLQHILRQVRMLGSRNPHRRGTDVRLLPQERQYGHGENPRRLAGWGQRHPPRQGMELDRMLHGCRFHPKGGTRPQWRILRRRPTQGTRRRRFRRLLCLRRLAGMGWRIGGNDRRKGL